MIGFGLASRGGTLARIFMFDAYGTLFDVHSAVIRAGAPLGDKAQELSALWRQKQLEYSWVLTAMGRGGSADFWTLTERALDFAMARFGLGDPALRNALLDAYRVLDAFPDVAKVLGRLKSARHRTVVFTNGTHAMVKNAIAASRLGGYIDQVISVEQTGHFKPAMPVYAVASRLALADHPSDITFVSSNRWDIAGAFAAGFTPIWVNRAGLPDEYPGLPPLKIVPDLHGVD